MISHRHIHNYFTPNHTIFLSKPTKRYRFSTGASSLPDSGFFYVVPRRKRGPGGVVSIATGYGLDGPGIESRWGARFSAPVQTAPGAHPAFCTTGTGSFPGVKSSRGVTLTPHTF